MSAPRSRSCSPDPRRQTLGVCARRLPPIAVGRERSRVLTTSARLAPSSAAAARASPIAACVSEKESPRCRTRPSTAPQYRSQRCAVRSGSPASRRPFLRSPRCHRPFAARQLYILVSTVTEMRLYDLRVTVERIEGRSVCGLEVGDYFELTESSRIRIPEGRHFCMYALQSVLPLLPAKQRRLPRIGLARAGLARLLPRPRRTSRDEDRTNRRANTSHGRSGLERRSARARARAADGQETG